MGIGFVDSIIVYNQCTYGTKQKQTYFGTRFDKVRVELTEGANITKSGLGNASACIAKITSESVEESKKLYMPPKVWLKLTTEDKLESFTLNKGDDFFVIVYKADLDIDVDLPVGMIESDNYKGHGDGFLGYVKAEYGYAYTIGTVDVYTVIPRFEIGGK